MDFCDEDLLSSPSRLAAVDPIAAALGDDAPPDDEEDEEEGAPQDFRHFSSLFSKKKGVSGQTLRRGEKDFEAHGTRAQEGLLEQSRRAMEDVLSYTRVHNPKSWCRGWYVPEAWEGHEDVAPAEKSTAPPKREVYPRERVVGLDAPIGKWYSSMGSNIPNPDRSQPGWDRLWLLPEEALFLVERGSLDLWWPTRPPADIWPLTSDGKGEEEQGQDAGKPPPGPEEGIDDDERDDYSLGLPLSVEAAYALLIGSHGERGKVTLEKFQVYANLRRHGYIVLRAVDGSSHHYNQQQQQQSQTGGSSPTLLQWLLSLASPRRRPTPPAYGPLVRPGIYRSYEQVFDQLYLIPRHRPGETHEPAEALEADNAFRVDYHVWKASTTGLAKTRPPPPDFYVSVVDARATTVPSLSEVSGLLGCVAPDPPRESWKGMGTLYPRLKHGHRNVILAVVDHGIVNYIRFAEGAFGEEPIWSRFDQVAAPRGGKKGAGRGGGGGGRGGGRGGRGRGRGRHRA